MERSRSFAVSVCWKWIAIGSALAVLAPAVIRCMTASVMPRALAHVSAVKPFVSTSFWSRASISMHLRRTSCLILVGSSSDMPVSQSGFDASKQ